MRKETIQYFHALAFSECTPEQAGKAMASLAKTLADEDPSIVAYGTDSLARWAIQKPAMREAVVEVFETALKENRYEGPALAEEKCCILSALNELKSAGQGAKPQPGF